MASHGGSISLPPRNDTFLKVFLKHQLMPNPKPPLESLSVAGQTAVITGGNAGIGLECGRLLLSLRLSHLILAVRSIEKGETAALSLRKAYPKAKIDVWLLDMNSYESIRAFAKKCATLPHLDIAILSAGIMNLAFEVNSSTGHEETFQVNYLSTALLALLLLPALKNTTQPSTPGRLTLVASGAALIAEFSERNATPLIPSFDKAEGWNASIAKKRYDTTKGLVLMLVYKLSTITKAEDTVINVVDPTFTPGTGFFRNLPFLMRLFAWPVATLLGTSVNKAAWTYIYAAIARGTESHGSFLSDWEINPFHAFMYTEEGKRFMDRLWIETLKELDFPEVRDVLESLRE
ncbi:putative short-chain dehydrogenase reductase family protein-2 [Coleophoma cylindrospora]|uniref:Putative short-chain dehydrogenase reductase family protein-2 n=1 Tax=Coleophoma cylindrospora TaxID=1849047 RepID=A0A3D8QTW4_9HELO|nr:putative short-chain dehydrogenase reductase family protein-2 [Coleophoma cylindrospora]